MRNTILTYYNMYKYNKINLLPVYPYKNGFTNLLTERIFYLCFIPKFSISSILRKIDNIYLI